jgi:hypothetical protein
LRSTTIYGDGGYFQWAWTLVGQITANPLTCAQAMADGAELIATVTGGTTATSDIFTCSDGRGLTSVIPAGSYTVAFDALQGMVAVGTGTTQTNQTINAFNKVTDLGTIPIQITGK